MLRKFFFFFSSQGKIDEMKADVPDLISFRMRMGCIPDLVWKRTFLKQFMILKLDWLKKGKGKCQRRICILSHVDTVYEK